VVVEEVVVVAVVEVVVVVVIVVEDAKFTKTQNAQDKVMTLLPLNTVRYVRTAHSPKACSKQGNNMH